MRSIAPITSIGLIMVIDRLTAIGTIVWITSISTIEMTPMMPMMPMMLTSHQPRHRPPQRFPAWPPRRT